MKREHIRYGATFCGQHNPFEQSDSEMCVACAAVLAEREAIAAQFEQQAENTSPWPGWSRVMKEQAAWIRGRSGKDSHE